MFQVILTVTDWDCRSYLDIPEGSKVLLTRSKNRVPVPDRATDSDELDSQLHRAVTDELVRLGVTALVATAGGLGRLSRWTRVTFGRGPGQAARLGRPGVYG